MEKRHVEAFVHVVWSTWRRQPLLDRDIEEGVVRSIIDKCLGLGCAPIAVGGTEDHVHLLARLHPATAIARLVGEVKGVSSHFVNHLLAPGRGFGWQQGYAAFSVGLREVASVETYVLRQKEHHASGRIAPALEPPNDS